MFLLLCILVMWLMIFGLAGFYFGSLEELLTSKIIYQFTLTVLVVSLFWLLGGYGLSFKGHLWSLLWANSFNLKTVLEMLFQLCFCLYAVLMLIGSVIDRVKTGPLLIAVLLWTFLVYCPLAYLIWNSQGFFSQLGVKDFSGGIVVHLSAGLSSYLFAHQLGKTSYQHLNQKGDEWNYLGMLLVTFGWFGFNAGPVGQLNQAAGLALLNTLLAMLAGGLSWSVLHYVSQKEESTAVLLNGIIVGLVTSTAGVGYLSPWQMLLLCLLASALTYLCLQVITSYALVDDVLDSFAMNGLGGFFGSLFLLFFYPNSCRVQLGAIGFAVALSASVSYLIGRYILKNPKRAEN